MYSLALIRACEILGGIEALQAYLNVPKSDLRRWLREGARPPDHVFLRVADLLAERDLEELRTRGGTAEQL
jgi:hypothetical protein